MKIWNGRAAAAALTLLLGSGFLAACAGDATGDDVSEPTADAPESSADATTEGNTGEAFGCTDEMFAHLSENGFPGAEALDPANLDIPETSFSVTPDCYVVDETGGGTRYSAFWATAPDDVVTELGAALASAGYEQSEDYGPYVWWMGGEEPTGAEHAIGAAPQPVGSATMLWATWS